MDVNIYDPQVKDALENLVRGDPQTRYLSQQEVLLEITADQEAWNPSESVTELVSHYDEIKIQLIDANIDLSNLYDILMRERDVGLILLGQTRRRKPTVIVLATTMKFFVIDPNDVARSMPFLKNLLLNPNLYLWITEGTRDAACLHRLFRISLRDSSLNCCASRHTHLMKTLAHVPSNDNQNFYPTRAMKFARRPATKQESFETLVRVWLDVDRRDIFFDTSQLVHLHSRPLNLTARNIIMKRCVLVKKLVEDMDMFVRRELEVMNNKLLSMFLTCSPEIKKDARSYMRKCEESGTAHSQYFSHSDGFETPHPAEPQLTSFYS